MEEARGVEPPGLVVRRLSRPLCKTDMHVASVGPPEAIRTPEPGFVVLAAVHLPGGMLVVASRAGFEPAFPP